MINLPLLLNYLGSKLFHHFVLKLGRKNFDFFYLRMEFWSALKRDFAKGAEVTRLFIKTQAKGISRSFWISRSGLPNDEEFCRVSQRFGIIVQRSYFYFINSKYFLFYKSLINI